MLTKPSDFKGIFEIANVTENQAPLQDDVTNIIPVNEFISVYEPECFIKVLGYTLYKELEPELLKKPFIVDANEQAAQKWIDLVNGKDKYKGLRRLLTAYIFYYFLEDDTYSNSAVGVVQERAKGASNRSPRMKAVKAWRTFVEDAQGRIILPTYLHKKLIGCTTDVIGIIYNNDDDSQYPLYTFLKDNEIDYPEANPSVLKNMTFHGI